MRRRVAIFSLLLAWLCANGAVWNVVQLVAWAKMFHDNAQMMTAAEAIETTLNGSKPCELCKISQSAQNTAREQEPVSVALGDANGKIILIADAVPAFELVSPIEIWPGVVHDTGLTRTEPVPVRPPRV